MTPNTTTEVSKYRLLKKYETPYYTYHIGVEKTIAEWIKIFPQLNDWDFPVKSDWFELVKEQLPIEDKVEISFQDMGDTWLTYHFQSSKPLSSTDFPLIKQTIENVLNPSTEQTYNGIIEKAAVYIDKYRHDKSMTSHRIAQHIFLDEKFIPSTDTATEQGKEDKPDWMPEFCQQMVKDAFAKEILEAEHAAFYAARETHPMIGMKHKTFSDYKNNKA